jgi:hypothetical protein
LDTIFELKPEDIEALDELSHRFTEALKAVRIRHPKAAINLVCFEASAISAFFAIGTQPLEVRVQAGTEIANKLLKPDAKLAGITIATSNPDAEILIKSFPAPHRRHPPHTGNKKR